MSLTDKPPETHNAFSDLHKHSESAKKITPVDIDKYYNGPSYHTDPKETVKNIVDIGFYKYAVNIAEKLRCELNAAIYQKALIKYNALHIYTEMVYILQELQEDANVQVEKNNVNNPDIFGGLLTISPAMALYIKALLYNVRTLQHIKAIVDRDSKGVKSIPSLAHKDLFGYAPLTEAVAKQGLDQILMHPEYEKYLSNKKDVLEKRCEKKDDKETRDMILRIRHNMSHINPHTAPHLAKYLISIDNYTAEAQIVKGTSIDKYVGKESWISCNLEKHFDQYMSTPSNTLRMYINLEAAYHVLMYEMNKVGFKEFYENPYNVYMVHTYNACVGVIFHAGRFVKIQDKIDDTFNFNSYGRLIVNLPSYQYDKKVIYQKLYRGHTHRIRNSFIPVIHGGPRFSNMVNYCRDHHLPYPIKVSLGHDYVKTTITVDDYREITIVALSNDTFISNYNSYIRDGMVAGNVRLLKDVKIGSPIHTQQQYYNLFGRQTKTIIKSSYRRQMNWIEHISNM